MPTPLHLSDEEMDLLLALAAPIDQRQRTQFLTEVTAAIRGGGGANQRRPWPGAPAGAHGSEALFRSAAAAQRRQDGARLKGEVPSWNTTGEAAIYRSSSVLAFSDRPALVPPNESIGWRGRDAVAASSSVPVTSL